MKKIMIILLVCMLLMSFTVVANADQHIHDDSCQHSVTIKKDSKETIVPYYIPCPRTGYACDYEVYDTREEWVYSHTTTEQKKLADGTIEYTTWNVYKVYDVTRHKCLCGAWGPTTWVFSHNAKELAY